MACLALCFAAALHAGIQPEPRLLSVSPAQGTADAAPRGGLVFVFDQPMDTAVPPLATLPGVIAGNHEVVLATGPIAVAGHWGTDQRTLVLRADEPIPLGSLVAWTLNPEGASHPLRSAAGQPLPPITGSFQIAPDAGGSSSEECPPPDPIPTTYTVSKLIRYQQSSGGDPILAPGSSAIFGVTIQPSSGSSGVLGGSLEGPDGFSSAMEAASGQYRLLEPHSSVSALEAARPSGAYTLRIHRLGGPDRVVSMSLPPLPGPVPRLANYDEAQAVDASRDFTLRWNAFASGDPAALVRVILSDETGRRLFLAPDACGRRLLDPAADSIVIPAGFLRPGFRYEGQLVFGLHFHKLSAEAGSLVGGGYVQRTTSFPLRTLGGPGEPPQEWCASTPSPDGSYTVVKRFSHQQAAPDLVRPVTGTPAFFGITVQGPPEGPEVTSGALTLPGGVVRELTRQSQLTTLLASRADEAALEQEFPPGDYTMRWTQPGLPEQTVALTVPAMPSAVPRILNFAAAQDLDATEAFRLEWEPLTPQPPGAFLRIYLFDRFGNLVFLSPNACLSRTLSATATSVTLPAGVLRPGVVFDGLLVFGVSISVANQEGAGLPGELRVERSTAFTLRARDPGGPNQGMPAGLSAFRIGTDGFPEFQVTGPAHASYRLLRSSELDGTHPVTLPSVQLDAAGNAVVEDAAGILETPSWYRALGD